MRISLKGASDVRVLVFVNFAYWLALTFAKALGPFGGRGRWPWRALRWWQCRTHAGRAVSRALASRKCRRVASIRAGGIRWRTKELKPDQRGLDLGGKLSEIILTSGPAACRRSWFAVVSFECPLSWSTPQSVSCVALVFCPFCSCAPKSIDCISFNFIIAPQLSSI